MRVFHTLNFAMASRPFSNFISAFKTPKLYGKNRILPRWEFRKLNIVRSRVVFYLMRGSGSLFRHFAFG